MAWAAAAPTLVNRRHRDHFTDRDRDTEIGTGIYTEPPFKASGILRAHGARTAPKLLIIGIQNASLCSMSGFDQEEAGILRDFERGELTGIRNFEEEKQRMESAARDLLKKDRRINIRISSRDLENLRKRAAKEGMPYQTLISSTLHKYVTGKLKPVE